MSSADRQQRLRIYLAFAAVYVLWGSTYLAIRVGVETIPPALLTATRFLIAGLPMLAWCALTGRSIALSRADFVRVASIGVLLLTGGNLMVSWSEQYVPSGLAALIVANVPIFVALIESWVLRGDQLSRRGVSGLFLGMAGLVVLLWPKVSAGNSLGQKELLGALGLLLASLSWATGSVCSRKWSGQLGIGPLPATAWEMTCAGTVNLMIALASGEAARLRWTPRGLAAVSYLVVCGSWLGFTAYIWLLGHVPTPKVATYAYVNPIVAVFVGWLILHERIDVYMAAGTAIVVVAVMLVTGARVRRAAPPPERVPAPAEAGAG